MEKVLSIDEFVDSIALKVNYNYECHLRPTKLDIPTNQPKLLVQVVRFYNRKVAKQQSVMQEEWWEGEKQMETRFFKNEIKKMVRGPFASKFS